MIRMPNGEQYLESEAMTADEYVSFVQQVMPCLQESYAEHYTQYHSECVLFGDAGPGQGLTLRRYVAEISKLQRQYDRLTKRT